MTGTSITASGHYRAHSLALWTWLIPQLQKVGRMEFLSLRAPELLQRSNSDPEIAFDPEERLQELSVLHHLFPTHDDPGLYLGGVRPLRHMAGHYIIPSSTTTQETLTTLMPQPPPPPPRPTPTCPPHLPTLPPFLASAAASIANVIVQT